MIPDDRFRRAVVAIVFVSWAAMCIALTIAGAVIRLLGAR